MRETDSETDSAMEAAAPPRAFAEVLRQLDRGRVHARASQELGELIQAFHETGKAGSITLKIDIKPASENDSDMAKVEATISTKLPKPGHAPTLMYVDDEFRLTRRDPRQMDLEDGLRPVAGGRE